MSVLQNGLMSSNFSYCHHDFKDYENSGLIHDICNITHNRVHYWKNKNISLYIHVLASGTMINIYLIIHTINWQWGYPCKICLCSINEYFENISIALHLNSVTITMFDCKGTPVWCLQSFSWNKCKGSFVMFKNVHRHIQGETIDVQQVVQWAVKYTPTDH